MSVVFSYDGIQLFNTGLQLCLEIRVGEKARVAPTPYSQVSTKWVLMPIYLFYQNFPPSQLPVYYIYRVSRVKLANCRWLFETKNMDSFLIKWYFYYRKGGEFYMVLQKSRKKSRQALKISVKVIPYSI